MAVFSIWESQFPTCAVAEGRQVTEAIWQDMQSYAGYLRHAIVEDLAIPDTLSPSANGRVVAPRIGF